jgi:hypothetical protein
MDVLAENRSCPSQLTLTPHRSESPQEDDITASSPSTDSQGDDHTAEPHNFTPSSVPPRRRLHLLSSLLKSRDHPASTPSTPARATASQLLNRPGSLSNARRGEGLISRKLFGNKGKDKNVEPRIGGPPEPLDTWDMLSDVEREISPAAGSSYPMPPVSSTSEYFPSTSRQFEPLLSHGLRREGTRPRPKHLTMLNPPAPPPTLPLTPTITLRLHGTRPRRPKHLSMLNPPAPPPALPLTPTATMRPNTHMDPRAATIQRQPTAFAVSATALASAAVPSPSSQKQPARPTQATAIDNPTRGRSLRATASMIWHPVRPPSPPVASPTRSTTTSTSPSPASLQSGVTNVDYDAVTAGHESQGTLSPSPVREEEENFVTPPGSPVRSPLTLPIPTISRRRPSPVCHEAQGPVSPASPARSSETHAARAAGAARTPTITPRPSINALHAFAPPNPSPLSNQLFERQALMPPIPPSPPRRDTVSSVGDTESLIDLYAHSGPSATASTATAEPVIESENTGDPMHHHYPGRPLPHPPGASQSGPVRPVLLDAFLGSGNISGGLPAYEEIELERQGQGIWHFVPFSQTKASAVASSNAPSCLPPVMDQPGPRAAPPPPPDLFTVFDEDALEPSSPGSTYEIPPSTPPSSTTRKFAGAPDVPDEDDEPGTTMTSNNSRPPIAFTSMLNNARKRMSDKFERDQAGSLITTHQRTPSESILDVFKEESASVRKHRSLSVGLPSTSKDRPRERRKDSISTSKSLPRERHSRHTLASSSSSSHGERLHPRRVHTSDISHLPPFPFASSTQQFLRHEDVPSTTMTSNNSRPPIAFASLLNNAKKRTSDKFERDQTGSLITTRQRTPSDSILDVVKEGRTSALKHRSLSVGHPSTSKDRPRERRKDSVSMSGSLARDRHSRRTSASSSSSSHGERLHSHRVHTSDTSHLPPFPFASSIQQFLRHVSSNDAVGASASVASHKETPCHSTPNVAHSLLRGTLKGWSDLDDQATAEALRKLDGLSSKSGARGV